jgi:hypothetical protein
MDASEPQATSAMCLKVHVPKRDTAGIKAAGFLMCHSTVKIDACYSASNRRPWRRVHRLFASGMQAQSPEIEPGANKQFSIACIESHMFQLFSGWHNEEATFF